MHSRFDVSGSQKTQAMQSQDRVGNDGFSVSKSNPKRSESAPSGLKAFFTAIKNFFAPSPEVKAEREYKRAEATFSKSISTMMTRLSGYTADSKALYAGVSLTKAHEKMMKQDGVPLMQRLADGLSRVPSSQMESLRNLGTSGLDKMLQILKDKVTTGLTRSQNIEDGVMGMGLGGGNSNSQQKLNAEIREGHRDLDQIFTAIRSSL